MGIEQLRIDQQRWNAMFGGRSITSPQEGTPLTLRGYEKPIKGVGQILKEIIITRYRIPSCEACHTTAVRMNAQGVDWCRANVDTLAEEIHQNATQRKWVAVLDFATRLVYGNEKYKALILEACDVYDEQLRETRKRPNTTWTVGMTVAYREKTTFNETLQSLAAAGWSDPYIFAEPNTNTELPNKNLITNDKVLGNWQNFCNRVEYFATLPRTTHYLLVQDDVEFLPDTRTWLENNWPDDGDRSILSLYRSSRYLPPENTKQVWSVLPRGTLLLGALALVLSHSQLVHLRDNMQAFTNVNPNQDDMKLSKYVHNFSIPVGIAVASRCQHTGDTSSLYPHARNKGSRRSSSYSG